MGVAKFTASASTGIGSVHAVRLKGGGFFLGEIDQFRGRLHAAGQFIAAMRLATVDFFQTPLVDGVQGIEPRVGVRVGDPWIERLSTGRLVRNNTPKVLGRNPLCQRVAPPLEPRPAVSTT